MKKATPKKLNPEEEEWVSPPQKYVSKEWIIYECIRTCNLYCRITINDFEIQLLLSPLTPAEEIENELKKIADNLTPEKSGIGYESIIPRTYAELEAGHLPIDLNVFFEGHDNLYVSNVFEVPYAKDCINFICDYTFLQYLKGLKNNAFPQTAAKNPNSEKPKFSLPEIALMHFYCSEPITGKNADEIALKHGHKSGHALYQDYNKILDKSNRIGSPSDHSARYLKKRIASHVKIIEKLTGEAKSHAERDLKEMEQILERLN